MPRLVTAVDASAEKADCRKTGWRWLVLSLPGQMFVCLAAGLALGAAWPAAGRALEPLGLAFVQAIKMIVIPLVFATITLGIYRMGQDIGRLGRVALAAFGWFLIATLISIVVALSLNALFHPGMGADLVATGKVPQDLAISVDWTRYLLDLIPANVIAAMAAQQVLPTLIFAVLFGLALAGSKEAGPITGFLDALARAMFLLTRWIVATSPLAVFAVMAWLAATQGIAMLLALAKLIGLMYLGLALIVVIFWGILLLLRERPFAVTRQVFEPVLLAFTTRSSEVALPLHMQKLEEMGVPNQLVSVVLPLGYSFNLDGSTMYIALACTFLAEAYGVHLDGAALFTILLTALIASKGIANVPAGGMVALATVLTSVGLPVEAIAIIAGVDAFMDMGRTAINVFGNTIAVLLVRRIADVDAPEDAQSAALDGTTPRAMHSLAIRVPLGKVQNAIHLDTRSPW